MTTTKQVIEDFEKYRNDSDPSIGISDGQARWVTSFLTSKLDERTKEIIELVEGMKVKYKDELPISTFTDVLHHYKGKQKALSDLAATLTSTYL